MRGRESVLITTIIILTASLSFAGGRPEPEVVEAEPEETMEIELEARLTTRRLIGQEVRDDEGRLLGSIDELFLDLSSGSVAYLVLALGDEEISQGRYPVPFPYVLPDREADGVVFPIVDRDILEWAPRMRDFPEETRSPAWSLEIDRFWQRTDAVLRTRPVDPGMRPVVDWRTPSPARYSEVSGAQVRTGPVVESERLTGIRVTSAVGESLGTVADYVVNMGSGRVAYAMVATAENRLHPVPLPLFVRDVEQDSLVFQASAEHLRNAPVIEGNGDLSQTELAKLRSPDWEENTLQYWSDVDIRARHRYGMRIVPGLTLRHEVLIEHRVVNTFQQEIGVVDDLIITGDGRLLYLEVSFGGFLGLGENRYALPLSAVDADPLRTTIILDLPREELEEMPLLEADALPSEDAEWDANIRAYWHNRLADVAGEAARDAFEEAIAAHEAEREETGALRARSAFGTEVTANGQSIGEIAEILVDIEEPAVTFVVVEVTTDVRPDEQMVPVPADRLVLEPGEDSARAQTTIEELRDAPSYLVGALPVSIDDHAWIEEVRAYWAARR
ncbi:MAG: PRC-barrel domain containing protein [Spirochaetaceae bacterium]|nr:MAG: PRC-barrel domain containing protein [Spirochaetaceae bacterium]